MDLKPKSEHGSSPMSASSDIDANRRLMNMSITELISKLRTSFLTKEYDQVEKVLIAKETQLKGEVEKNMREIGLLREIIELEKLDKMNAEEELKKCKEECEKRKKAEERYEKLMEAVKKNGLEDRDTIAELRIKNRELEDEKRKAELLVESWKRKIGEFNERILRLENDTKLLMNGETHDGGNTEGKSGVGRNTKVGSQADPGAPFTVKEEKETNEIDVHGREFGNKNADSTRLPRNEDIRFSCGAGTGQSLSNPNRDALGASACGRLGLGTLIVIEESDDDECVSQRTLNEKESTSLIVTDNGHPSSSAVAQQKKLPSGAEDVMGMLKRKLGSRNSGHEFGTNLLDRFDTEDDSSSTSSESELDMERVLRTCHGHTIEKRRKT